MGWLGRVGTRHGSFPQETSLPDGPPGRGSLALLAGGGNAYADQDQHGRRRQADHQRHLGRRKASLVLEQRNDGRHVNSPTSRTLPAGRTPPPVLASTLAPSPAGRGPFPHREIYFPTLGTRDPSRAPRGSYIRPARNVRFRNAGHWYQLFPSGSPITPRTKGLATRAKPSSPTSTSSPSEARSSASGSSVRALSM